ncbi:tetratricopeptide repeat protein [Polyangium jinanense]|uniref:Tetratricopeptide repeat protein n=1 Tax=Polyangium jinanense TaxID=2829994 RepID=A0A9X3WZE7_9BACT|nr:tetratricopeptide repeat protein [Polyangium jinanense]MDC3953466.1 tetratricopeptide repeat protein [Polyangium jinanense]MDC3979413.1 tetratricopeptide repeat protein [Polyangium jinanense]
MLTTEAPEGGMPAWAVINNRGNRKQEEGDLDGAIADFTEAMKLAPGEHAPIYNRGNARSLGGDVHGALDDYTTAIEMAPEFAPAWQRRGLTKQRHGDLAGAIADLDEAIRLAPDEPSAYGERAALRALRADFAGAVEDCERALAMAPPDWHHRPNTQHLLDTIRKAAGNQRTGTMEGKKEGTKGRKGAKSAKAAKVEEAPQTARTVVEEVLGASGFSFALAEDESGYIDYLAAVGQGIVESFAVRLAEELERVVVYVMFEPKAKKELRAELAEFITRANFGMGDGNFEMDFDDGSVRFKVALDYTDEPLSALLVRNMIFDAMDTTEVYADALARVIAGKAKAKTAVRAAEKAAMESGAL